MTRPQAITLIVASINLLLALIFPPFDYINLQRGNVATFDGFYFYFSAHPNRTVNADFLALALIVMLINAAIAWLLFRERPVGRQQAGGNRLQRAVLWLVGLNLLLVVLFPPFQNFTSITRAAFPTFEGFYFLFSDNTQRQLVTPILYMEVFLVLINGGILWLLFNNRSPRPPTASEIRDLAEHLRQMQKKN